MLKHIPPGLRSGLVVAVAALVPLTEAAAQVFWDPQLRVPPVASRECTIVPGNGMSVRIVAGPFAGPFPATVTNATDGFCPIAAGACLRWDYQWIYTGLNPSLALASVASNVKVIAAPGATPIYPPNSSSPPVPPTTFDTSINFGNVGGELGLRYTANAATYNASFYTDTAPGIGPVSAGFKSGNRNGFCAIAGANIAPAGDPLLSKQQTYTTNTLGCTVTWTQSPDGCVASATTTTPGCNIVNKDLLVFNTTTNTTVAATTASCGTEVAGPFGSTETCKWNSILRKTTCVTVP